MADWQPMETADRAENLILCDKYDNVGEGSWETWRGRWVWVNSDDQAEPVKWQPLPPA